MHTRSTSVLIVDDSPFELELTSSFLREHLTTMTATNGLDALELVSEHKPMVVLLDVNMPDMNGYEVCRRIREFDSLIKIIFISANNSTEEILNAYESGGDDYIIKPYMPDILLSKVIHIIQHNVHFVEISKKAQGLAMDAMTSLGELGIVVTFLKASFRAANIDALATLVFGFLDRFQMKACLQLRTELHQKNYSSLGILSPIEEELLFRVSNMNGRFAERGSRMFINYEHASLMIKNMPVEDELKMGRARDNLAIILEGANEKLSLLAIEEETKDALNFIQDVYHKIETENSAFVAKTIHQIESAFAGLGMTEEQESNLINLIRKSQSEFEVTFEATRAIESKISNLLNKIQMKLEDSAPSFNAESIDFF